MKAVLLCGGHGTRLRPLTYVCNKHLLPVYFKDTAVPIVELVLEHLYYLGVKNVAVVLGDFRGEDIITYFHKVEQDKPLGMKYTYYYQGEPLGIAHAVSMAKDFLKDQERFFVLLGDNIFIPSLKQYITNVPCLCQIFFTRVEDPKRFGCPVFDNTKTKLQLIEEKPQKPQTDLALTGAYLFDTKFYFEAFSRLKPSSRGEYELTDIINMALKKDPESVRWSVYKGFWSDAGTFESFYNLHKKLNNLEEKT